MMAKLTFSNTTAPGPVTSSAPVKLMASKPKAFYPLKKKKDNGFWLKALTVFNTVGISALGAKVFSAELSQLAILILSLF